MLAYHGEVRIAIAADHAGFDLKHILAKEIESWNHQVIDLGANELNPQDDYPDFAEHIGRAIQQNRAERGVLICGSGVGASIAANKLNGVRAGLCHDAYSARQGVEHDDMNVIVLGARIIGPALAHDLVETFLKAEFSGEERHRRRLEKIEALESTAGSAGRG
jgi:ribose 5-phosphate isomerase B